MNDQTWETFDALLKILHRQGRRVEELEQRVVELERRLSPRAQLVQVPVGVEEEERGAPPTAQTYV